MAENGVHSSGLSFSGRWLPQAERSFSGCGPPERKSRSANKDKPGHETAGVMLLRSGRDTAHSSFYLCGGALTLAGGEFQPARSGIDHHVTAVANLAPQ